jgi:hypothetical protein
MALKRPSVENRGLKIRSGYKFLVANIPSKDSLKL